MILLKSFATTMRAQSLIEDLDAVGIKGELIAPFWSNKKQPPPKKEVRVNETDVIRAREVLTAFEQEGQ